MAFLNPEKIISSLSLRENMSVADFGCGSGGWSIPLAQRIKDGQIYAIDVTEESLSALRSKINSEKLGNIRVVRADLEKGSGLRNEFLDMVVVSNILFQAENKSSIIREAKRVLKKGGQMLVVDWLPNAPGGPQDRVSAEEVRSLAQESGFTFKEEVDAGVYHYAHLYEKN